MIVNSLYAEGGSEAHFYPITANLKCDCNEYKNLDDTMKTRFSEYRLNKLLGGDASTIETNVIEDETQYKKDVATLEYVLSKCPSNNTSNPITNILKNPLTYRSFGLILLVIVISYVGIHVYKDNKKNSYIHI